MNRSTFLLFLPLTLLLLFAAVELSAEEGWSIYLPVVWRDEPTGQMVEMRGLWVTRFDWTSSNFPANPNTIDTIVENAAGAGFNAIFFQVRGTADAYYTPGLEPWAQRVSGDRLGDPPPFSWDPLAYFIERAHAHGMQLHAYLNVYPVWTCGEPPPPDITPTHLYYLLREAHGTSDDRLNGLQWTTSYREHCDNVYVRATPASFFMDDHIMAVATDITRRYDIDGLHLDNIRYGGTTTSCDPVSEQYYGASCFTDNPTDEYASYEEWQRAQVNGTVRRFYNDLIKGDQGPIRPNLWLSAAVWPVYRDYWGWGLSHTGYDYYYQDSKAWVQDGYIDAIMPMIYPARFNCPDDSFWTLARWQELAKDFQASRGDRYVIPGIGTGYCTFDEIAARIEAARATGTAGHALFSYGGLAQNGYFDDLAAGPYLLPATPPAIDWHP